MRVPERERLGVRSQTLTGCASVMGICSLIAWVLYAPDFSWPVGSPKVLFFSLLFALASWVWVFFGFFLTVWLSLWLLLTWFLRLQRGGRSEHERFGKEQEKVGTLLSVVIWGLGCVCTFSLVVPQLHERRWGSGSLVERVSSEWAIFCEQWLAQVGRFFSGTVPRRFADGRLHVLVSGDLLRVGGWEPAGFLRRPVLLNLSREHDVLMSALEEAEETTPGQVFFFSGGQLLDGSAVLESWKAGPRLASGDWRSPLFHGFPFLLGWMWLIDHVPGLREIFPAFLEVAADDRRALSRIADELADLPSDFAGTIVVALREGADETAESGAFLKSSTGLQQAALSPHRVSRTMQTAEALKRTLNTFDFGQTLLTPMRNVWSGLKKASSPVDSGHFSVVYADRLPSSGQGTSEWTLFQSESHRFVSWSDDNPCHVFPLSSIPHARVHGVDRDVSAEERQWSFQDAALAERLRSRPTFWCLVGPRDESERGSGLQRMIVGILTSGADGQRYTGLTEVVEWILPVRRVVRLSDPLRSASGSSVHRHRQGRIAAEVPGIALYEAHWTSVEPDVIWKSVSASQRGVLLQEWFAALLVNPSQVADELAQILRSRDLGG